VAFVEIVTDELPGTTFGAGIHTNIITASIMAVIGGFNRIYEKSSADARKMFFTPVSSARTA
jgi:2-isopropylmalate synthase